MNKFLNFLGLAKRSGNILEGYNKCEENINKKKIYLFLFSNSISERSKEKFLKYCQMYNILYIDGFTKEELGYSIGRSEINIIGITDENMAKKLLTYKNNN
ncbi:ribosomal L7Ae/L30e/S12e/Gadd45 family protein [Clostridium tarantellae]|uniref:50S ribosomal protein L7ae-like protein n=1 Tax=Clostridium tarantellae TaxID=39493 RepID=A0A6I1MHR6_9CLOT|nr:ribosomal L7Ae/L30e/S12e/Gadd45 family protein [Clostridium tarantellae]MPQ42414.1 50S ribosomal protein L7ae-like protein [Clostridium tarantellae]